jgi:hypothetical protein
MVLFKGQFNGNPLSVQSHWTKVWVAGATRIDMGRSRFGWLWTKQKPRSKRYRIERDHTRSARRSLRERGQITGTVLRERVYDQYLASGKKKIN